MIGPTNLDGERINAAAFIEDGRRMLSLSLPAERWTWLMQGIDTRKPSYFTRDGRLYSLRSFVADEIKASVLLEEYGNG